VTRPRQLDANKSALLSLCFRADSSQVARNSNEENTRTHVDPDDETGTAPRRRAVRGEDHVMECEAALIMALSSFSKIEIEFQNRKAMIFRTQFALDVEKSPRRAS
jgi:hypothetical protein